MPLRSSLPPELLLAPFHVREADALGVGRSRPPQNSTRRSDGSGDAVGRAHSTPRASRCGPAAGRRRRQPCASPQHGPDSPEPECNGEILLPDGVKTWGDLMYRPWRVVFEWDGEDHRLVARRYRQDVERLNDLALAGWIVVRVNRYDAMDVALRWLDRALRSRGWAGAR